jgi:CRISPR system Cascade subunit CasD
VSVLADEQTRSVLLRLEAPLQAWGDSSRFEIRNTNEYPTVSGITGLIACALGHSRELPLGELANLEIAVRIDDPGQVIKDFQTVGVGDRKTGRGGWISAEGRVTTGEAKLSTRYLLSDSCFTAAVGHPDPDLLDRIAQAINRPRWALFLGRKSCPPASPILIGVSPQHPDRALTHLPYQGHQRRPPSQMTLITTSRDGRGDTIQDVPVSYHTRTYRSRAVVHTVVTTPTPQADETNPYDL